MKVNDFRITYSAVEGVPAQMTADCGSLGSLVRPDHYVPRFESLLRSDDDPLLTTPWPYGTGELPAHNYYWAAYIVREIQNHQGSAGKLAFQSVVPMRRKAPLVRFGRSDRSFVEGWFFPHGVTATVTARFEGTFDPQGMIAAARDFMLEPLELAWTDQTRGLPTQMTLKQLLDAALGELRREAFGDVPPSQANPFITRTIVRATKDQGEDDSAADPFVKTGLAIVGAGPNTKVSLDDAIYAHGHGRFIWRSDYAFDKDGKRHTLACLHRNVSVSTMQVASLVKAAEMLAAANEGKSTFPTRIEAFASAVAGAIGRIYGQKKTWPKQFLTDQIAAANKQSDLSKVRMLSGMTPLQ